MERLFVGGIWDGKRQPIPEGETTYVAAPRMVGPRIKYDHYRLVKIVFGTQWVGVFVVDDLDESLVLGMLIEGYRSTIYERKNPQESLNAQMEAKS